MCNERIIVQLDNCMIIEVHGQERVDSNRCGETESNDMNCLCNKIMTSINMYLAFQGNFCVVLAIE